MIKVRVPATSANLGSGFDCLGIALSMYNTLYFEEYDRLEIVSLDKKEIPTDENNMVYKSFSHLYDIVGRKFNGIKIYQKSDIPMARGLGSSSACLVGGLLGANALLNNIVSTKELINISAAMEGHPDNTTPAILGGLVTCAIDMGKVYSVSVPVDKHVKFVALIPPFSLPTAQARSVLPTNISRNDAVYNISRAALITASLFSGKLENLKVSTDDMLHQQYRMGFISGSDRVFKIAYDLGALGVYISGAGSTIMAIINNNDNNFSKEIRKILNKEDFAGWEVCELSVDSKGAEATSVINLEE